MARRATAILVLATIAASAAPAVAYETFQSPSGNIACAYNDGVLRCDLMEVSNRQPPMPADCELDYGRAFEMAFNSRRAGRICHGDTVSDRAAPVLDYGRSWEGGGFSCLSSEKGISCRNARGAGWDLSRARQTLY